MEPLKHHYIPEFYLKRWAAPEDDKLCQWQRHRGIVKPLRVYPAQTGYVHRLYELKDFPPNLAQQVESRFFQSVDTQAANALSYMEHDGRDAGWSDKLRSAWARFLISLLLRCPEDLAKMRPAWERDFFTVPDEVEERFRQEASSEAFSSFRSYLESLPLRSREKPFFELLISLMSSQHLGELLINMHWAVINATDDWPLYTSDRPVVMTEGLDHHDGYILLPIGPTRLFVAATSIDTIRKAEQYSRGSLTKYVNQLVIQHAVRFAYTQRDNCQRFIQNRMNTVYQTRLADRLGISRNLGR